MRLNDIDLTRLLPQFMREDRYANAFAYAVQSKLIEVSLAIQHAKIYSRIDSLAEEILDELAWQFNVVEYRTDFDISIKRELIKRCMESHYKRGTVEAVEDVVLKIFGDAEVEEWFNYGGEPYHFRIHTSNTSATDEMIRELTKIVKETQNVRSYLEAVIVEIIQSMTMYIGARVIVMDEVTMRTVDI